MAEERKTDEKPWSPTIPSEPVFYSFAHGTHGTAEPDNAMSMEELDVEQEAAAPENRIEREAAESAAGGVARKPE